MHFCAVQGRSAQSTLCFQASPCYSRHETGRWWLTEFEFLPKTTRCQFAFYRMVVRHASSSKSMPFLPKPENLGGLVGAESEFDPLGFSDTFDVAKQQTKLDENTYIYIFLNSGEARSAPAAILWFFLYVGFVYDVFFKIFFAAHCPSFLSTNKNLRWSGWGRRNWSTDECVAGQAMMLEKFDHKPTAKTEILQHFMYNEGS